MGFPGPGEDTEQTPSHCDTRVSTHRARGRHAPAPEDGGRGKESEDERENVSLGAGRPQPPARAKHSPGAPPGAGETPPAHDARPRSQLQGARANWTPPRELPEHTGGGPRAGRRRPGPCAAVWALARRRGLLPCARREAFPAPVTEPHGGWLPVIRCLLSELESRRELDRTPSTQVVCGTPAVPSEGRSPL